MALNPQCNKEKTIGLMTTAVLQKQTVENKEELDEALSMKNLQMQLLSQICAPLIK